MKRFWCIVCAAVKRARTFPTDIQDSSQASPCNRRGTCEWHHSKLTHKGWVKTGLQDAPSARPSERGRKRARKAISPRPIDSFKTSKARRRDLAMADL